MTERIKDPVNYELTGDEPADEQGYKDFLDRLTDVPESEPLVNLAIDEAGITNQQVIVNIENISKKGEIIPVMCDITMGVSLDDHRGIHMSRCEEALFDLIKGSYSDIDEFSAALAEELRKRQKSASSVVKVRGRYLHPRLTRKTGKATYDKVVLLSEARDLVDEIIQRTGVEVCNMTACPCTRTHTKFSVVPQLRNLGLATNIIRQILEIVPTGTHTQRGTTSVIMDKTSPDINSGTIYGVLDAETHLVNELLKRPDEHDLVIRALRRPQFTEDVIRDVARGLHERFGTKADGSTRVEIESILNDSIHIHDVRTRISSTLEAIGKSINYRHDTK